MNNLLLLAFFLITTVIQIQVKPGFLPRATAAVCILLLAAVCYIDASIA